MRQFYTLIFYLLTPMLLLRLYWRGYKAPAYRQRWSERLGVYQGDHQQHCIWFHAVSVGEAEAVFPLVKLFQLHWPEKGILVTTTTPTGSARVKAVLGESVEHVYLPYDIPWAIKRFIAHFKPCMGVVMETEIWPNLYRQCGINKIPFFIINARLSERSAKGYKKIPALIKPALAHIKCIATQSLQDTERFVEIGAQAKQLESVGNIKFDLDLDPNIIAQGQHLKQQVFAHRLVWIIASTHRNEEEIFLQIYREIKPEFPDLLLVIVPRHPERFAEVQELCNKQKFEVRMRTDGKSCQLATDVYIGNTMGELKLLYAASDVAFVGGSMVNIGGHNVLEPAAIGMPILFGPYMANFKAIEQGLLDAGAALQCQDKKSISAAVICLFSDLQYRQVLAKKAQNFVIKNQGALKKVYEILEPSLLEQPKVQKK